MTIIEIQEYGKVLALPLKSDNDFFIWICEDNQWQCLCVVLEDQWFTEILPIDNN